MFEFILAGFSGSLLSYLIIFECGGFCANCANRPIDKMNNELKDLNYKLNKKIDRIEDKLDKTINNQKNFR